MNLGRYTYRAGLLFVFCVGFVLVIVDAVLRGLEAAVEEAGAGLYWLADELLAHWRNR